MPAPRARHRATASPLPWSARGVLTLTTVPVGALAGCVVAALSSSLQRPEVGVAGLAAAGVPLGVHGWRARRARVQRPRGRHVAGLEQLWAGAPHAEAAEAAPVVEAARVAEVARGVEVVEVVGAAAAPVRSTPYLATPLLAAPVAPAAPAGAAARPLSLVPAPVASSAEVRVRVGEAGTRVYTVTVDSALHEVLPGVHDARREAEIASLRQLWESGTGPDTGVLRPVAAPAA